tara:strand:+ start:541 stop:1236 length:696 start_codon:yes stop_codon:yes gene_type:complete
MKQIMTDRQIRIKALIKSIITYLDKHHDDMSGVEMTLRKLEKIDLSDQHIIDIKPRGTRHDKVLNRAISGIKVHELNEIASCLYAAKDDLVWHEDNSKYYQPGANLGPGYSKCNLHTLLIGPNSCGYQNDDFLLGLFMLGPRTLYRDHKHDAPELYLNLTDQSGWRFKSGEWQDYPAGSFIWNAPGERHAARVYEQPFISVFAWLENVNSPCQVIHFDDWEKIEKALLSIE